MGRFNRERATQALNAIDRDITRAMLSAEIEVRKRNPNGFSPKLIEALQVQQFWELWRKELKNGRDLSTQRSLIEASIKRTLFSGRPTPRQLKENIREAYNAAKEASAKSLELRDEFLRDKAKHTGKKNEEKAYPNS